MSLNVLEILPPSPHQNKPPVGMFDIHKVPLLAQDYELHEIGSHLLDIGRETTHLEI